MEFYSKTLLSLCLFIIILLVVPVPGDADQAQYFYDELGRLVRVIDNQGKVAA